MISCEAIKGRSARHLNTNQPLRPRIEKDQVNVTTLMLNGNYSVNAERSPIQALDIVPVFGPRATVVEHHTVTLFLAINPAVIERATGPVSFCVLGSQGSNSLCTELILDLLGRALQHTGVCWRNGIGVSIHVLLILVDLELHAGAILEDEGPVLGPIGGRIKEGSSMVMMSGLRSNIMMMSGVGFVTERV